jgi:hypothetical protein
VQFGDEPRHLFLEGVAVVGDFLGTQKTLSALYSSGSSALAPA